MERRGRGNIHRILRGKGIMRSNFAFAPSTTNASTPTSSSSHIPSSVPADGPTPSPSADQSAPPPTNDSNVAPSAPRSSGAYDMPHPPPTNKFLLQPAGKYKYVDSLEGTNTITEVMKLKLTEPYKTWKDLPPEEANEWFEEWKKYVTWNPLHEAHMRQAFNKQGAKHMSDHYSAIRNKGVKPSWMLPRVYDSLCAWWKTDDFKSEKEGREVSHEEIYKLIRTKKKDKDSVQKNNAEIDETNDEDDNELVWVDDRSQQTWEKYKRLKQIRAEQEAEGLTNFSTDDNLWFEAVGGPNKKGEVYGMPYLSSKYSYTSVSFGSISSHVPPELIELRQQQQMLVQEQAETRRQLQEEQTETRRQLQEEQAEMRRQLQSRLRCDASCKKSESSDNDIRERLCLLYNI